MLLEGRLATLTFSFQFATGVCCFIVMLYCYAMSVVVMLCYLVAGATLVYFFRLLHVMLNTHKGDFIPLMRASPIGLSPPDHCMELKAFTHYRSFTKSHSSNVTLSYVPSLTCSLLLTCPRKRHIYCYSCVKVFILCEYVKLMPCRHKGVIFVTNTTKELSF